RRSTQRPGRRGIAVRPTFGKGRNDSVRVVPVPRVRVALKNLQSCRGHSRMLTRHESHSQQNSSTPHAHLSSIPPLLYEAMPITVALVVFELVVMVLSISLHDSAQAWTANRLGDPTGRMMG